MIAYTNYEFDGRVRSEAEALASNGFRVRCLTIRNGADPRRIVLNGVEICELNVPKYQGKSTAAYVGSYLVFMLSASAACLRLLFKGELDVVHVHNVPDFLVIAALLPRLMGSKVVLDVHDSVPETFATKFRGNTAFFKALCLEEKFSALIAHIVVCVNRPQQEVMVARGIPISKTIICMNAPDPRIFKRASVRNSIDDGSGRFNVVCHGTMAKRLGIDLIIRAIARLQGKIPGVRLHLWGPGDDLDEFQRLAQALDVDGRVRFKPKGFPLEELADCLASMDLGVVGNRRTVAGDLMLPVKLMEYVALEIPSVVPRLKAIEHYFSEDMVAYFEPESVESMADSIYRLYSHPELRRLQVRRATGFLKKHGWERQRAELLASYQRLLEN